MAIRPNSRFAYNFKTSLETNMQRHKNILGKIENKLLIQTENYFLFKMEQTAENRLHRVRWKDKSAFADCSKETPKGRMNTCYDDEVRIKKEIQTREKCLDLQRNRIEI